MRKMGQNWKNMTLNLMQDEVLRWPIRDKMSMEMKVESREIGTRGQEMKLEISLSYILNGRDSRDRFIANFPAFK